MSTLEALISGCLQGVTEFLPISSSGHLIILHSLFRLGKPEVDFDILLHIATTLAVIIFFRHDIMKLFTTQKNMALALIIGSIPTAIIGFKFKDSIEGLFVRPKAVGFMFLVTAAVLILAALKEKFFISRKRQAKEEPYIRKPSFLQAFLIGISQGVAIVPGISRSGLTISSGILLGIDSTTAAKFSFLLSIPAVIGASLLKFKGITNLGSIHFIPAAVGFICAFLLGLASLKILLNVLSKGRLHIFAVYCILLGIFVIIKF